jgi:hypothetical protein
MEEVEEKPEELQELKDEADQLVGRMVRGTRF